MLPFHSPTICARCGSPDVATHWKVHNTTARFNLWTFLIMWFDLNIFRFVPDSIKVPVCSVCEAQLVRIKKIARGITIFLAVLLGLLLGFVYLIAGVRKDDLVGGILIMLIVTLFGAIVGAFGGILFGLIIQEAMNYEFCNFDGQYYHFKNKIFRREFAILNPTLIKPKTR
jgi:hypothetical protein